MKLNIPPRVLYSIARENEDRTRRLMCRLHDTGMYTQTLFDLTTKPYVVLNHHIVDISEESKDWMTREVDFRKPPRGLFLAKGT
jgi:hypothetical protein